MEDLRSQVEGLGRRLRLQSMMSVGVLVILMFAMGGADTVARALVEAPSWKVLTKNGSGIPTERLIITTDVNNARIQVANANIELAQQTSDPSGLAEGAICYNTTTKKLKVYNGTAWVEAGGGGAMTGSIGEDAFRLGVNTSNTLGLIGIGRNGGTVNIDGTVYGFTSTVVSNTASVANTLYYAYAYVVGTAVTLELSTTVPTANQYGVYATKTGDVSRRYVGMGHFSSGSSFAADFVRSVQNERGYGYLYKHAPATAMSVTTTNTGWTDFDPVINRTGLFFDQERVRAWAHMMPEHPGQWVGRVNRLGVSFAGVPVDDSEISCSVASGGYWAAADISFRSEVYVTVSGAGLKNIRPVHKTLSGNTAQWLIVTHYPASVGFEVLR
jgi:hypothetical protein